MSLDVKQIKLIQDDVFNEGISYSHLGDDLIDHICCDVEDRMQMGDSFEVAYDEVREEIGQSGLRSIQKNTLLLIDKNYRIMKKSMKSLGSITLAVLSVAVLAKLMHWPGATLLITLGMFMLAAVFLPASLFVWYKEVFNRKRAFIVVLTFISGFVFIAGTLFKIQHWPYAGIFLFVGEMGIIVTILVAGIEYLINGKGKVPSKGLIITGMLGLTIFLLGTLFKIQHLPGASAALTLGSIVLFTVCLPVYVIQALKANIKFDKAFIFSIYAITFILTFSFLLSINPKSGVLSSFADNDQKINQVSVYLDNLLNEATAEQSEMEAVDRANELLQTIDQIKYKLISSADDVSIEEGKIIEKDLHLLKSKGFDLDVYEVLNGENADGLGYQLYDGLEDYKRLLLNDADPESSGAVFISGLINTSNDPAEWIKENFHRDLLVGALVNLSQLQLNVQLSLQEYLTFCNEENVAVR